MKTATALVLMALISIVMGMAWALSSPRGSINTTVYFRITKTWSLSPSDPNPGGTCDERCSGDDSCPGEMKCCSNGCGHVCKPPVFKVCSSDLSGECTRQYNSGVTVMVTTNSSLFGFEARTTGGNSHLHCKSSQETTDEVVQVLEGF